MGIRPILLMLCLLCCSIGARATHIYGGELLYKNVTGNTYLVTLTLYGDCAAAQSIFQSLAMATPEIAISNNGKLFSLLDLDLDSSKDVSPVCPTEIKNTSCNGGSLPGVVRYVYSALINLLPSDNWTLVYQGYLNGSTNAGRSSQITNINNPGNTILYLEAYLNNLNGPNSSPVYSTVPTPYYCVQTQVQYNQGALDANRDSLVYSLVPAIDSNHVINYISPFTASDPLSTVPSTFSFNVNTGQIGFTPDIIQHSLVVCQVSEYRNGLLVGTSEREMTFIVRDGCTGNPPTSTIVKNSIIGAGTDSLTDIYVCEGAPNVAFNIQAQGNDNDTVTVTYNNPLTGAVITIQNNNTPSALINFNWNTAGVTAGIYNFYITIKDNHCPVSNTQSFAYSIKIVKPNTDTAMQLTATQCVHAAKMEYDFKYGLLPRTVTVSEGSRVIRTLLDTTGKITDSLKAGKYTIEVSSPYLNCPTFYTITVVDSGVLPSPAEYYFSRCINDPPNVIAFLSFNGASVVWHNIDGTVLPEAPTPTTNTLGQQEWYVIQTYNVCVSYADTVTVTVHDLPDIKITTSNAPICLGNPLYLTASGGATYKWSSAATRLFTDNSGIYAYILQPEIYTVIGTDTNRCVNTASMVIDSIENCCMFSYPNTFTPNGDNINDKYHIVTYGNTDAYELEIYNRYGQRVYHTFKPADGWDGTYENKQCENGTYFYYLRAHCLSGHEETHKGEITLYR